MTSYFSDAQKRAIQDLVGLPPRLTPRAVARRLSVPTAEIRAILGLDEPPYSDLLAEDRWVVGGAVLRWLCGGLGWYRGKPSDVDLFSPSLDAVHRTARELIGRGFNFSCFRTLVPICQLCGVPGERLEPGTLEYGARVGCATCGETGGPNAAPMPAERLLRLTPEIVVRAAMLAVDLRHPSSGLLVQLAIPGTRPTLPRVVTETVDFSVAQFGLDDRNIHCGPSSWTDLLLGRNRLLETKLSVYGFLRVRKYKNLGFRPYVKTYLVAAAGAAGWRTVRAVGGRPELKRIQRNLRLLAGERPASPRAARLDGMANP